MCNSTLLDFFELQLLGGPHQHVLHISLHGNAINRCFVLAPSLNTFVSGKGNISVSAEFNFYADPEAAYVVLNELGRTATLVSWELCLDCALGEVRRHRLNKPKRKTVMFAGITIRVIETVEIDKHCTIYESALSNFKYLLLLTINVKHNAWSQTLEFQVTKQYTCRYAKETSSV